MIAFPLVLRLFLCAAYLAVGIVVLVTQPFQSPVFDWPFGLACAAYGLYRAYRAVKDYQSVKTEE